LKRFLAPDLVLILGIWLSFRRHKEALRPRPPVNLLDVSVLIEHFAAATAAHCAGRREAGVMTEAPADDNPGPNTDRPNTNLWGRPQPPLPGLGGET